MPDDEWRLLDTGCADGPTNMAVDEAVLYACGRGEAPPTLRLYGWSSPCLSIGYFQRAATDARLEECRRLGIDLVRRPTGGRAVLHDRELTYSVVIPASHPLAAGGIVSSYRRISQGLVAGLAGLGLPVQMSPGDGRRAAGRVPDAAGQAKTSACFDAATDFELAVRGRKLVGSAQTRRRGAVLQHGSILLDFDAEKVATVLSSELPQDRFATLLRSRVSSLREALGREASYHEVAASIAGGFKQALGLTLARGDLTPFEIELAAELARTKYRSAQWNLRR